MAESKEKPATTEMPAKPQTVMVNATNTKGRLLTFPASVDECLEAAANAVRDQRVEDIINLMNEIAKDRVSMMFMRKPWSLEPTRELRVYELNDEFWTWFRAAAALGRKVRMEEAAKAQNEATEKDILSGSCKTTDK